MGDSPAPTAPRARARSDRTLLLLVSAVAAGAFTWVTLGELPALSTAIVSLLVVMTLSGLAEARRELGAAVDSSDQRAVELATRTGGLIHRVLLERVGEPRLGRAHAPEISGWSIDAAKSDSTLIWVGGSWCCRWHSGAVEDGRFHTLLPSGRFYRDLAWTNEAEPSGFPVAHVRANWSHSSQLFEGLLEMVEVPGGTFMMGSDDGDPGAFENEGPRHWVGVAAYRLARTPMTIRQFELITGRSGGGEPEHPVTQVSWLDALMVCNTLSTLAGRTLAYRGVPETPELVPGADGFRLPTEAQWEYACRAGEPSRFPILDRDPERFEIFGEARSLLPRPWATLATTYRVGRRPPNRWGLYDMLGNVWEWCWDAYQPYGQEATPSAKRVLRGGQEDFGTKSERAAIRDGGAPDLRTRVVGFRCAAPLRRKSSP